jgi:Outer membrane protein beta-barrel domain
MKPVIAALALAACAVATPAMADNDSGLYLGAGIGRFDIKVDGIEDVGETIESFESDDTTFKVFAGWRFNKFLGVELDYMDLGSPEDTIDDERVQTEINGVAPYLIGTIPLGPVEFFAKVGYYFYDVKIETESIDLLDESDEDLVYGAGIGLTLFGHLHARVEYEIIEVSDVDDANALWLSGAWRF